MSKIINYVLDNCGKFTTWLMKDSIVNVITRID